MSSSFQERSVVTANGFAILIVSLAMAALGAYGIYGAFGQNSFNLPMGAFGVVVALAGLLCASGIYVLNPNECALFLLFGSYQGSDRSTGMRWASPFFTVQKANLRTQTLITPTLKVNDQRGNPIEIAAAVVWHIQDAASASFGLQDIEAFLKTTLESTLREIASAHPYDHADDESPTEITLRGHVADIAANLRSLLRERMHDAGGAIAIVDTKLTHLAYAPEIANAMLRRQQAEAVVGARKKIVLGAVSMVDEALKGLEAKGIHIDDERRATMVGNLLVVLCSEREAAPVINAGSLY